MKRLALALLLASSLRADPVVSKIEQSYGPYPRPTTGGVPAIGGGGNGTLLAWSEEVPVARIHVGLLDSRARLISPISVLPAQGDSAEAWAPSVGFNGESFFVGWIETYQSSRKLWGMAIDATGTPVGAPQPFGSVIADPPPNSESREPAALRITWDGAAWHVASNWVAIAERNGVFATAVSYRQLLWGSGGRESVYIRWTAGERSGSVTIAEKTQRGTWTVSTPSVAPAGSDFIVAWCSFEGVGTLVTRDTGHSTTVSAEPRLDIAPGLACDDGQCLMAWGTLSGDVHGLLLDPDHLQGPSLLTIATSERKERAPQVLTLGRGRFFVAYQSDQGSGDQQLRGRIVTTLAVRRRAIR